MWPMHLVLRWVPVPFQCDRLCVAPPCSSSQAPFSLERRSPLLSLECAPCALADLHDVALMLIFLHIPVDKPWSILTQLPVIVAKAVSLFCMFVHLQLTVQFQSSPVSDTVRPSKFPHLVYRRTSNHWLWAKTRVSTGALRALDDQPVVQTKI